MRFTAKRGSENKLIVSTNIHDPGEFMYPAYQQALFALKEILSSADDFNPNDICNELYGYSQNIIAFSGKRGQGKTSTMLSFSSAMARNKLNNPDDPNDKFFLKYSFEVLPPIDPTIMESTQSILTIILSRMYHLAESAWAGNCNKGFSGYGPSESQKNELLEYFQTCLTSINAIKSREENKIRSLQAINEVSDSSQLKKSIYILTQKLLKFISENERDPKRFLVIQLDDTDFQVSKGHEILEDIRKFFSIPNVVILMATDMSLLRSVILQHYISVFELSLRHESKAVRDLEQIESKYVDKMIPPVYVVHLPKLEDSVLHYGSKMTVCYTDRDSKDNILIDPAKNESEDLFSAQELILRYIYKKTGIVFAVPSSYYHDIIPTTLRGLVQMLSLLSSMEDIPSIDPTQISGEGAVEYLKTALQSRIDAQEKNITLFENYLLNEWVYAKCAHNRITSIHALANYTGSNRLRFAVKQLSETYSIQPETAKIGYAGFAKYIKRIEEKHREIEDYYYIFAIRTCLTIQNHKAALRQMQFCIDNHKKGSLIFDFSPEKTGLANTYQLPEHLKKYVGNNGVYIMFSEDEILVSAKDEKLIKDILYVDDTGELKNHFNVLNFITLALNLGAARREKTINANIDQRWVYEVQMAALQIAMNLEVQHKIYNTLENSKESPEGFVEAMKNVLQAVDVAVGKINTSNAAAPSMLSSNIVSIMECINSQDPEKYIVAIDNVVELIRKTLCPNDYEEMNMLIEFYNSYIQHSDSLSTYQRKRSDKVKKEIRVRLEPELSAFIASCNNKYIEKAGNESTLFAAEFVANVLNGTTPAKKFKTEFEAKFELLCGAYDINMHEVKQQWETNQKGSN